MEERNQAVVGAASDLAGLSDFLPLPSRASRRVLAAVSRALRRALPRNGISRSSVRIILMWLVRFLIGLALPRARGMMRLRVGPSPTVASLMVSLATSRL